PPTWQASWRMYGQAGGAALSGAVVVGTGAVAVGALVAFGVQAGAAAGAAAVADHRWFLGHRVTSFRVGGLGGAQGAHQVCGELVRDAEVGAEGFAGDGSAVLGVVVVGHSAGEVDQGRGEGGVLFRAVVLDEVRDRDGRGRRLGAGSPAFQHRDGDEEGGGWGGGGDPAP